VAQKWYQKATVQAALAAGVLAFVALIFGPLISRKLEQSPDWIKRWTETPQPCQKVPEGRIRYYEAEAAELFGDASADSEHPGFSGEGYVSGYGGRLGASATFRIDVPVSGDYQIALCYGNATRGAKTLTIYVNDEPQKQTRLPYASRWNIWMIKTESLALKQGRNTISYRKDPTDSGEVNLDFIGVEKKDQD
jgi:Carbohydrate binding module (family 35)